MLCSGLGSGLRLGLGSGLVMSLLSRAWARRLAVGPEAGEEAVQRRALTHEAGETRLLCRLEQHLGRGETQEAVLTTDD